MRLAASTLVLFGLFSVPCSAPACECVGHAYPVRRDIAESVSNADLIFSGQVEPIYLWSPKTIPGYDIYSQLIAEFRVFEVFKGFYRKAYSISTGYGGAESKGASDCAFPFRAGQKYLVYANGGEYSRPSTDYCTRTSLLEYAEADMRYLKGQPAEPEDLLDEEAYNKFWERRFSSKICGKITSINPDPGLAKIFNLFLWSFRDGRWNWPYWVVGSVSDQGDYCTFGIEPGKYRIGAARGTWDQKRLTGYYGGADRMEKSPVLELVPNSEMRGIDFSVRQDSRFLIKGKVVLSGASQMPEGNLTIRVSNDWDYNLRMRSFRVEKDGSFEIKHIYPGRHTLVIRFEARDTKTDGAWWASVPEIMVPENASDVVITLRRETFRDAVSRYFDNLGEFVQRRVTSPRKVQTSP